MVKIAISELSSKVKSKGLRLTNQRRIILEELRKVASHPSADWIYRVVKRKIPHISFATVYRNLKVLKELGLILELNYGKEMSRFDGNPINHYHLVCKICNRIYDYEGKPTIGLEGKVSDELGFEVEGHRLEFYGVCKECKKERRR